MKDIVIIGAPVDCGKSQKGCVMGPDAIRCAHIVKSLSDLGHNVFDQGNLKNPTPTSSSDYAGDWRSRIPECAEWIRILGQSAYEQSQAGRIPVFLGGDHLMSAGTVTGLARSAATQDRPQFVLWLDAHTDFHTLETTKSGNLHGTPVAYFAGQDGFDGGFPTLMAAVAPKNICMIGIRSVDADEHSVLQGLDLEIHDMKRVDELGIIRPLRAFMERVKQDNGFLHVSLDVDFLDPMIAPGVGTTVPGGATFREAHLVMEILNEYDLVTSIDIAELNPLLDERGRTAHLIVDLIASLMGRKVFDRPNTIL